MSIRLGNLLVVGNSLYLPKELTRHYPGWTMGNWRLRGRYTYYLVKVGNRASGRQCLIIEPADEFEEIDDEILYRDMMALQFIMGEALQCPFVYGMHGTEIVACTRMNYYENLPGTRTPAISDHLDHFEYWIEPFFSKLSRALRTETTARLNAVAASLEARYGSVDYQVNGLTTALVGLAHWTVRTHDENRVEALMTRQSVERALAKLGIPLPAEALNEILLYEGRLRSLGSLTETIERSDRESEREFWLVETLRTVLVAMIAASVGYHGIIRGVAYDEGPPPWWRVDPDEKKELYHYYVAVSAPAPAVIPPLNVGEVLLIVEHRHHQTIVEHLLHAAGLPIGHVCILVGDGREGLSALVHAAAAVAASPMAILIGSPRNKNPSAEADFWKELGLGVNETVFCAGLNVDAWLLSDDDLLRRQAATDPELLAELSAMPLPEEVSDPFDLSCRILGPPGEWGILRDVDTSRAGIRSPSLRRFLSWMAEALGVNIDVHSGGARHLSDGSKSDLISGTENGSYVRQHALLGQLEGRPPAPIKAGVRIVIPSPWTLGSELMTASGFSGYVELMSSEGAPLSTPTPLGKPLWIPELAPGEHRLVLTVQLGDRELDNYYERHHTVPLTVLPNSPYIAGPPVRGSDLVGRAADLGRITDRLRYGSVRLVGERRIGKTSILHHFADHPGDAFVPVWLDAQTLDEPASFRNWILAALRDRFDAAPVSGNDLLPFLRTRAATGKTPLLLIDEIVHLRGLSPRDAGLLRSLSSPPLAAILAGSPHDWSHFFASLPDDAGSPFNHLQDVVLAPLTDVETRILVLRPGVAEPDAETLRLILELSGGRPYLVQRLCEPALARAYVAGRLRIERADVEAVTHEALVAGLAHQHEKRWAALASTSDAQAAVVAYARMDAPAPRALHDILRAHGLFDGVSWTVDPAFAMWLRERDAG
jgi:hypothetical protein